MLVVLSFVGMDIVDWFNLPYGLVWSGDVLKPVLSNTEFYYYGLFIAVTIASDTLFIAATRWLLRLSSGLDSRTKILGLMLGNVLLACVLVVVPVSWAWGVGVVPTALRSGKVVQTLNYLAYNSTSHQSFLATLAASNMLDGLVASSFFILLFTLLLHRFIWPIIQRPVYALATRDVVRRRRTIRKIGIALIGLGGLGPDILKFIEKVAL